MNLIPKIKILLVDDHQLFNDGIKSLLSSESNLTIVGQLFEGNKVLREIQKCTPEIIFLDINLPDYNGIDLSKEILQHFPSLKIILLTMYADEKMLKEGKKVGVHGYILKNSSKQELLAGINAVMKGMYYFDDKVIKQFVEVRKDDLSKKYALTGRETEIIRLVIKGLDSYQIAESMNLSYFTIKTHRRNIHFKLGTSSTAELIRFGIKNGI